MLVVFLSFVLFSVSLSNKNKIEKKEKNLILSFGTIEWLGYTVDLDFWCNTPLLQELKIERNKKPRENCFTLAKWRTAQGQTEDQNTLVNDQFEVFEYLPENIPIGGSYCCGDETLPKRQSTFVSYVTESGVSNRKIVSVGNTYAYVTQNYFGTVIETDKEFVTNQTTAYIFDENGLISQLQLWDIPQSIIDAFTED